MAYKSLFTPSLWTAGHPGNATWTLAPDLFTLDYPGTINFGPNETWFDYTALRCGREPFEVADTTTMSITARVHSVVENSIPVSDGNTLFISFGTEFQGYSGWRAISPGILATINGTAVTCTLTIDPVNTQFLYHYGIFVGIHKDANGPLGGGNTFAAPTSFTMEISEIYLDDKIVGGVETCFWEGLVDTYQTCEVTAGATGPQGVYGSFNNSYAGIYFESMTDLFDADAATYMQEQTVWFTNDWSEFRWEAHFDGFYLMTDIEIDVATGSSSVAANGTGGTADWRVRPMLNGGLTGAYSGTFNGTGAEETFAYNFAEVLANSVRVEAQSHSFGPYLRLLEVRASGSPAVITKGAQLTIIKAANWAYNDNSWIFNEWPPGNTNLQDAFDTDEGTSVAVVDPGVTKIARFGVEFAPTTLHSYEVVFDSLSTNTCNSGVSIGNLINSGSSIVSVTTNRLTLTPDGSGNPQTQSTGVLLAEAQSLSFGDWGQSQPINIREIRIWAANIAGA